MATVNKPTDPKQKEIDVNRKLQFYGILNAFQLGKVPSVSSSCFASRRRWYFVNEGGLDWS